MLAEAAAVSTLMGRSPSRWLLQVSVGCGKVFPRPHHCSLRVLLECPPSMAAGFPQSEQSGESREKATESFVNGPLHSHAYHVPFLRSESRSQVHAKGKALLFFKEEFWRICGYI